MEGRSPGVQVQIEKIDIVVFSVNNERREILVSERPVLGSFRCVRKASQRLADSNAKLIVYAIRNGGTAGFGLDGGNLWNLTARDLLTAPGPPSSPSSLVKCGALQKWCAFCGDRYRDASSGKCALIWTVELLLFRPPCPRPLALGRTERPSVARNHAAV